MPLGSTMPAINIPDFRENSITPPPPKKNTEKDSQRKPTKE